MEGMMKPVELRFVDEQEANVLLGKSDEMWAPHGNPILDSSGTISITMVKTIPIRLNFGPERSNLLIPDLSPRMN